MELTQIYTRRNNSRQNYAQPIIYEWEDVISNQLDISVKNYPLLYRATNKLGLHAPILGPANTTFTFVNIGRNSDAAMNNKHVIPCIIDFYEKGEYLQTFYDNHSRNQIVLFSSPFDYEYLKKVDCPLNIGLFAYSLPDKYAFSEKRMEKKYDIVLTARQDPLLYSFFKEYIKRHPNVTYVKRGKELENDTNRIKEYYLNGKECLGTFESRDEFMKLQSQGRVTLYGLQGYMDDVVKGFFHMTPHFLEVLACGCHVLCHYPLGEEGVDAKYYEFDKFSPSIETYEQFELAMDNALRTDIDMKLYTTYLQKHYTSTRVSELKQMLMKL